MAHGASLDARTAFDQQRMAFDEHRLSLDGMRFDMDMPRSFEMQEAFGMTTSGGSAYDSGISLMLRRDYERAIGRFDQVIAQKAAQHRCRAVPQGLRAVSARPRQRCHGCAVGAQEGPPEERLSEGRRRP